MLCFFHALKQLRANDNMTAAHRAKAEQMAEQVWDELLKAWPSYPDLRPELDYYYDLPETDPYYCPPKAITEDK